jgi:hypothetical protein
VEMEELKQDRIEAAKRKMQDEKKKLHEEK